MIFLPKSQPGPDCLHDKDEYNCGDVLERLYTDFKNKCYICENKDITSINIEHFMPHEGDEELKFDWNNLFFSCAHCNNIKSNKFKNLLNCTEDNRADTELRYTFKEVFPVSEVIIKQREHSPAHEDTRKLLMAVYNGTTLMKQMEARNLRKKILKELNIFHNLLADYFSDASNNMDKTRLQNSIQEHLEHASAFTAFKRWIIREDAEYYAEFGNLL